MHVREMWHDHSIERSSAARYHQSWYWRFRCDGLLCEGDYYEYAALLVLHRVMPAHGRVCEPTGKG
jgi:hypothetical protein